MRLTFGMKFGAGYWVGWKFERQGLLSEAETEAKFHHKARLLTPRIQSKTQNQLSRCVHVNDKGD